MWIQLIHSFGFSWTAGYKGYPAEYLLGEKKGNAVLFKIWCARQL